MKKYRWYILLSGMLILSSALSYLLQILIFHKSEDTFFYLLQDLSFVPVQVMIVTLILDKLLQKKEKDNLLRKLNMVVGVFYNEIGTGLLGLLNDMLIAQSSNPTGLNIAAKWTDKDFTRARKMIIDTSFDFSLSHEKLELLKKYLISRRDLLLQLMANPNLLEHDSFTDMLLAVFHVTDELYNRQTLGNLPQPDILHLKGDIKRCYSQLINEWLTYIQHLQKDYPYLFSLSIRCNPFNRDASILFME